MPEIKHYLEIAGLLRVATIGTLPTYVQLISALVERWRLEMHNFCLPVGECTIILEDVAVLLRLRTDG